MASPTANYARESLVCTIGGGLAAVAAHAVEAQLGGALDARLAIGSQRTRPTNADVALGRAGIARAGRVPFRVHAIRPVRSTTAPQSHKPREQPAHDHGPQPPGRAQRGAPAHGRYVKPQLTLVGERAPYERLRSRTERRSGAPYPTRTSEQIMSIALLPFLAGMLASQPAEAPLAVPLKPPEENLRALIDAAGTSADHDGAGVVAVLDHTTVDVEDSGLSHYRHRRVLKILTEAGATETAALRFDYDPASNFVEITRARIHPRAGDADAAPPEPVELGPERLRDLPQPQHWIYWGPRMKVLAVPRLQVGDALEVQTYTKGFIIAYLGAESGAAAAGGGDEEKYIPPMRGHFYDVVLFGKAAMPTLDQRYEVTLPLNKPLQYEIYNGEIYSAFTFKEGRGTYAYWKKKLPPHKPEPRAADASDYLPKVVMATAENWEAKSRWFAQVNEKQFEANDAIRAKVREITRGAGNDDEKIDAILHWTAQEIRYSGITMGKGEGYTLHTGEMTFNDRAGVCKDIASMSITMLRAAGFTSHPAMTMAGSRVERVPADQFNHCVVAVDRPEGYRMIDPTWAPFSAELWSSAEREQHYVIGTPKGETLMMTQYLPPEHNHLKVEATTKISATGDLVSDVRISGNGYLEDRLRRLVAYRAIAELRPSVEALITRVAPTARLDTLRFSDHHNLKKPMIMELRYRVPGYARVGRGVMRTHVPTSQHLLGDRSFADWLTATETPKRTSAIWLRSPQRVTFSERITVPKGLDLVGTDLDEEVKTEMGSLRATLTQRGATVYFDETIRITQRNIAPKDYAALKRVVDAVRALGERSFFFDSNKRPGGGS